MNLVERLRTGARDFWKNSKKKLRTAALDLMLSAAIIGAFNGCTTVTPWETVAVREVETGKARTESQYAGTRNADTRILDISGPYWNEGDRLFRVIMTSSLKREGYNLEKQVRIKEVNKVLIEQRKEERDFLNPIFLVAATIGGAYAGSQIILENGDDTNPWIIFLGGGIGFFGAGAIIKSRYGIKPQVTKTETRETEMGRKEIYSEIGKATETYMGEEWLYMDQPGKIKFTINGKTQLYITDENGVADWGLKSNGARTRDDLEKRLYDFPLVKEMKPETREKLRGRLLEAIIDINEGIDLETKETPDNVFEKVENCKKHITLNYVGLTDDRIYNVVQQFVDEEINSCMKTLEFSVREKISHAPIEQVNLSFSTDSPSKSDLLGRYFTGGLKKYAEQFIPDYLIGKGIIKALPSSFDFLVYSPSNIFVEVIHPEYKFVDGEIAIKGDTSKIVSMVDKGSKVRVENVEEDSGSIE